MLTGFVKNRACGPDEQVYPLRLGSLVPKAVMMMIITVGWGAFTYYILVMERKIGLGIFLVLFTDAWLMLALDPILKMPKSRRFASVISHQGLRMPDALSALIGGGEDRGGMVPWEEIDRILAVCFHLGVGSLLRWRVPVVVTLRRCGGSARPVTC